MKLSRFGKHYTTDSGVLRLMDDLAGALNSEQPTLMLGGGNPARIPAVERLFRERMLRIMEAGDRFERLIGHYEQPEGTRSFARAIAGMLNARCGMDIGEENVALTTGSQAAFFYLFNLLAGPCDEGHKKILLPMVPEYIGYTEVGLEPGQIRSYRPSIEELGGHRFKYRIDFDRLQVADDVGAICVSRPTNPTGNVLSDAEITKLSGLAGQRGIPLIVDGAYGMPFPGIVFTDANLVWEPHVILVLSLSKLGLPGTRSGIVIAAPEIIRAITTLNAIVNLAPTALGAALVEDMLENGEIIRVSRELIAPYYRDKVQRASAWLDEALSGTDYRIHVPEGALFLWLWLPTLTIDNEELYRRLKARGVLVLAGHYFFPGAADWEHGRQCIRISYAQDDAVVSRGIEIIAEEVRRAL